MPQQLTPQQLMILNHVVQHVISPGEGNWISGKRIRLALGVTTDEIRSLHPQFLRGDVPGRNDNYSVTLAGLLQSARALEVKNVLLGVMQVILGKFKADPDFFHFTLPELDNEVTVGTSARDIHFVDMVMRLSEIAERSSSEGTPVVRGWYLHQERVEQLFLAARQGDFTEFIGQVEKLNHDARVASQEAFRAFYPRGGEDAAVLDDDSTLRPVAVSAPQAPRTGSDPELEEALSRMSPSLAACYRQAMRDIGQLDRESFVGPAAALRELVSVVLRELAPDSSAQAESGYAAQTRDGQPSRSRQVRKRTWGSAAARRSQRSRTLCTAS